MNSSLDIPPRYAYLGPAGTFCEQALRTIPLPENAELVPSHTVPHALDELLAGTVEAALIPFENSVEGSVRISLDYLITSDHLMITREVLLPVAFDLYTRQQTSLDRIFTIATHAMAEAQCRQWVRDNTPNGVVTAVASTADAAAAVGRGEYDGAICAAVAGEKYGLYPMARDIADNPGAVTRFVLVTRSAPPPGRTGHDLTSLVVFIPQDRVGALQEVLTQFAMRDVNLTRIESRPTKEQLGRYCFYVDCEGHIDDLRVAEALKGLHRVCSHVRYLGSYPQGSTSPRERYGLEASDKDFESAEEWIEHLRNPLL